MKTVDVESLADCDDAVLHQQVLVMVAMTTVCLLSPTSLLCRWNDAV